MFVAVEVSTWSIIGIISCLIAVMAAIVAVAALIKIKSGDKKTNFIDSKIKENIASGATTKMSQREKDAISRETAESILNYNNNPTEEDYNTYCEKSYNFLKHLPEGQWSNFDQIFELVFNADPKKKTFMRKVLVMLQQNDLIIIMNLNAANDFSRRVRIRN